MHGFCVRRSSVGWPLGCVMPTVALSLTQDSRAAAATPPQRRHPRAQTAARLPGCLLRSTQPVASEERVPATGGIVQHPLPSLVARSLRSERECIQPRRLELLFSLAYCARISVVRKLSDSKPSSSASRRASTGAALGAFLHKKQQQQHSFARLSHPRATQTRPLLLSLASPRRFRAPRRSDLTVRSSKLCRSSSVSSDVSINLSNPGTTDQIPAPAQCKCNTETLRETHREGETERDTQKQRGNRFHNDWRRNRRASGLRKAGKEPWVRLARPPGRLQNLPGTA